MADKNHAHRYPQMRQQYENHLMASRRHPDPSHRVLAFVVLMVITSVLSLAGFIWFAATYWA